MACKLDLKYVEQEGGGERNASMVAQNIDL
jgi:hypothetical protein